MVDFNRQRHHIEYHPDRIWRKWEVYSEWQGRRYYSHVDKAIRRLCKKTGVSEPKTKINEQELVNRFKEFRIYYDPCKRATQFCAGEDLGCMGNSIFPEYVNLFGNDCWLMQVLRRTDRSFWMDGKTYRARSLAQLMEKLPKEVKEII